MVLDGAIKAPILIRFLEHLVRDAGRKVFLILDRLQVHRAGLVRAWLDGCQDQIAVFYLLAYSLDLNPDESLNDDVKQAVTARPLACSKGHIKQTVITHMRSLSKRPKRVAHSSAIRSFATQLDSRTPESAQ